MNKQIDMQQIKDGFERIKDLNDNSFSYTLFGSKLLYEHMTILILGFIVIIVLWILILNSLKRKIYMPQNLSDAILIITGLMIAFIILHVSNFDISQEVRTDAQQKLNQKIEPINMSYNEIYDNPTHSVNRNKLIDEYKKKIIEIYGYDNVQVLLKQNNIKNQTEDDLVTYLERKEK